ncbi:MAG: caspase family protein [Pseudomonadota bacterium]
MRFLLVMTVCIFAMASDALAERRVALVIGNASYQTVQALDNPENDAAAVAKSLETLGFEVLLGLDLDQRGMQKMVREYSRMLIGSDVALFYYAGHGIQVSGRNYLIPVDADLQDETDLNFSAVDFDLILGQMEREPRVKLLFLDACRDNPFKDKLARSMSLTRSNARVDDGLAKINLDGSDGGTLIAFATDPGAVALDGTGQTHSPFTKALLEHIETPGLEIHSMMIDVRSAVWERTHKRQRPWSNSSLTGKFFFSTEEAPVVLAVNKQDVAPPVPDVEPKKQVEPEAVPGPQAKADTAQTIDPVQAEIELEFWRAASQGNTIDEYLAYMDQFPQGRFTMIAAARIERLKAAERTKGLGPITGTPTAPQAETALGAAGSGTAATAAAVAAVSPEVAEQAMGMNRSTRRELQHRLRLAGFDPGGADGVLGPNSRAAITGWQTARQIPPTGYMSNEQFATLKTETEPGYQQLLAQWAAQARARKQAARQQSTSQPRQATTQQEPKREGSHLGKAFRKIGHGVRDIFR